MHRAPQLPAQLGKLCRAPSQLRLEPANTGREVPVLVDAGAEEPLRLRGSSGYGETRLVRHELGSARKHLPVTANERFRDVFDRFAKPLIGWQIEVRLRQVPGHSKAATTRDGGFSGATTDARPQPLIGHA